MKTLIIYDNSGQIFTTIKDGYLLPQGGLQYLEEEIPEGKHATRVDISVTPHKAILEDIPPSEIDILRDDLNQAVVELSKLIAMGGTSNV